MIIDADLGTGNKCWHVMSQLLHAATDRGGKENGSGFCEVSIDLCLVRSARSPFLQGFPNYVPMGVSTGRERLPDPGRSMTQANIAMFANGICKLTEATMLLGRYEAGSTCCPHQSPSL
ncbi:hypothetical protein AA11825_0468 [Acetobacter pomorum DSM 11825]|nr:hypothetical protein AA11825_0468 [Acetobacter pomorum DSM 11825]